MKDKSSDFELEDNTLQFQARTWRMNTSTVLTIPCSCAKLCQPGTQVTVKIKYPNQKRKEE